MDEILPRSSPYFLGPSSGIPNQVTRIGHTINVESGCFQGQALSAYRYPHDEVVQVSGATPWRQFLKPYQSVDAIFFPQCLADIKNIMKQEELSDIDDYLEWLLLMAEENGFTPNPAIMQLHEKCFNNIVSLQ